MTNAEAILKECAEAKQTLTESLINKIWRNNSTLIYSDSTEARIILDALEKQIPKKPILNKNKINPHWVEEALLCPTCNRYVGSSGDKFCGYCGQAIEWL